MLARIHEVPLGLRVCNRSALPLCRHAPTARPAVAAAGAGGLPRRGGGAAGARGRDGMSHPSCRPCMPPAHSTELSLEKGLARGDICPRKRKFPPVGPCLQTACIHPDPARRPAAAEVLALLMSLPASRRPAPPPILAEPWPVTPPRVSPEAQRPSLEAALPSQGRIAAAGVDAQPLAAGEGPPHQASAFAAAGDRLQAGADAAADALRTAAVGPARQGQPCAAGQEAMQGAAGCAAAAAQRAASHPAGRAGEEAGLAGTLSLPSSLTEDPALSPAATLSRSTTVSIGAILDAGAPTPASLAHLPAGAEGSAGPRPAVELEHSGAGFSSD